MIVIGLLILVAAAAVCAGVIVGGAHEATVQVDRLLVHGTTATFFLIGAGTALTAMLGLWCVVAGIRRSVTTRRREQREYGVDHHGAEVAGVDHRL
jgi:ABC-type Fe3+ transport system permease subunit